MNHLLSFQGNLNFYITVTGLVSRFKIHAEVGKYSMFKVEMSK